MTNKPLARPSSLPARMSQAGFSLAELMVAVTISLLVLVALIAVYANLSRSNSEMAKTNIQIENGRFAIQLLQNDIAHAGFWGTYVPQFDDLASVDEPKPASAAGGTVPTAIPDPCLAYTAANWSDEYKNNLLGIPVHAGEAAPAGCTAVVASKKADTDVLVVRHAETCLPGTGNCEADTAGKLYFQSTLCADESGTPYVLGDAAAGFTLTKRDCATAADKRKFVSSIYYIRNYAVTPGDNIPTLMRSQLDLGAATPALEHQAATELIEGIEGFRVELGIDNRSDSGAFTDYTKEVIWANPSNLVSPTNRGDGIPDGDFIRCTSTSPCTADQLVNAVAVRIHVLARAREATPGYVDTKKYKLGSAAELGPFNDGFKRHVFSTTVRLNNISGRRETP